MDEQTALRVPVKQETPETKHLEEELALLRHRMKWQYALWWILFILLVVFGVGFLALSQWETRTLHEESSRSQNVVLDRMDRNISGVEERLGTKDLSHDDRIDRVQQDVSAMNAEISALQVKIASLELSCLQNTTLSK